ncbi:MAG: ribonuclease R [Lachnospiraceae bacterium]|nr:ribonuclease R [Lachnospiraceae bacterium]
MENTDPEIFEDKLNIDPERKAKITELVNDSLYVPMKEKEMALLMQVEEADKEEFKRLIKELVLEGKLTITQKGKIMKGDGNVMLGTFISNQRGFGFVEVEGVDEDFFIPEDKTLGAFHKDKVQIMVTASPKGKRKEAVVLQIVERGFTKIVGTFEKSKKNYGFVIPDNAKFINDIFIPTEKSKNAVDGHKVVCEITDYGNEVKNPEGKIVEIIGHINDPGVDIMSIVRGYDLPVEFSDDVMNETLNVPMSVSGDSIQGRADLRDVTMVTIDGEDAKDLDDAVSLSFDGSRYTLGVHIADVSEYVKEGSFLDREAKDRGTSVYLVDRVIPMLPHALSNGICSLNQKEDRLALSCIMTIDKSGTIEDYKIQTSVINVNRRMSYNEVKRILDDPDVVNNDPRLYDCRELVPMFLQMRELSQILREKRRKRGSIDFDIPECKIILDKKGHPVDIKPYERNAATDMIEDFMLAANETVAEHFYWLDTPFVYRVHDVPDAEKIQKLTTFINNYGFYLKSVGKRKAKADPSEVHPKEIQKLLEKIAGTDEEPMITRMALRSMKQAKYSVECEGHFGLACKYYCHFTSPIRRYPDLQIHRIIKESLKNDLSPKRVEHYKSLLPLVAKHSSDMERRADEAERETDKLKKVEFMEQFEGCEFDGVVSGVTAWGLYVELPNTCEGMVHISKIPGDYYNFFENTMEIVGERTGNTFRLGQPVRVMVEDCDRFMKTIDFSLVN